MLTDWYLPGTKAGGPVRSVYSMMSVLKDEYDFYLITRNTDLGEKEAYTEVRSDTLFSESGISYYYFSVSELTTRRMEDLLTSISPDMIYLNSFWSYFFSISIVRAQRAGRIKAPVLLAPRGMLGRGALSLKAAKKNIFLLIARFSGQYRHVIFHASQENEKADIRRQFSRNRIMIAPNINALPPATNQSSKKPFTLRLFFLSRISRVKNLHFALEVLTQCDKNLKIEYDIYGNIEESEYWKDCLGIMSRMPANISVRYMGELPFNRVQDSISAYHALLLPTLNENYGHSIVESLLSGCPVIISDQTPWTDVSDHNAGAAISLGDKNGFADAINRYAQMDEPSWRASSDSAIEYITARIDLARIKQQYKAMFDERIKN